MANHIPEDKIAEIRHAVDIAEIISETVLLRKAGKNLVGLCPFHSEKSPSFTVSPDKQIFHCFGCSAGGNVFSFVMKRDGLQFGEAARMLARRCGVDIPERPLSGPERRLLSEQETLFEINRLGGPISSISNWFSRAGPAARPLRPTSKDAGFRGRRSSISDSGMRPRDGYHLPASLRAGVTVRP